MPLIEWSDKYDLKVGQMNHQHQGLMEIMNKLYDQSNSGAGKEEIISTLGALGTATVSHFSDEEKYMESVNYPELDKHKIMHRRLLEKFAGHSKAFSDGGDSTLPPAFFNFLKLWLSSHIQGNDMKYAEHGRKS